jgi:hypothetical protein
VTLIDMLRLHDRIKSCIFTCQRSATPNAVSFVDSRDEECHENPNTGGMSFSPLFCSALFLFTGQQR